MREGAPPSPNSLMSPGLSAAESDQGVRGWSLEQGGGRNNQIHTFPLGLAQWWGLGGVAVYEVSSWVWGR